jgi:hypothetical protein
MPKNDTTKKPTARRGGGSSARPNANRLSKTINLVEIRPGLFLNLAQIVTMRVLPREEGEVYAILQLSNGDKLSLTSSEFSEISGEKPRPLTRKARKPDAE